jgi:putative ABC transport system ATP-binding protein
MLNIENFKEFFILVTKPKYLLLIGNKNSNHLMLVIQDLHKSYDTGKSKLHVLKGINLNIEEGEFVSIMGSSGSGKSTLLNIIGILDEKDSGVYDLDGIPIEHLNEVKAAEYRSKFLGFVFQSFNLIGYKTALDNVALPLYYQNVPRKERNQKAMEYLEKVGLAQWATHLPNELSGGQKQRVAIARALITNPKVVLADEPTGALDSKTTHDIMKLLQDINNEGKTIIVVTHEPDVAAQTKRNVILRDGIIESDEFINQIVL